VYKLRYEVLSVKISNVVEDTDHFLPEHLLVKDAERKLHIRNHIKKKLMVVSAEFVVGFVRRQARQEFFS